MASILDPKFKYTSSTKTDIRKTFAKIRKEQAAKIEQVPVQPVPMQIFSYRRVK